MDNKILTWSQRTELNIQRATKNIEALSNGFLSLSEEVKEVKETLLKRVYLSNSHLISVKKCVKEKVSIVCKEYGYDYKKAYRHIIQALYRDINGQYNVPSYRELPEAYYDEIITAIRIWVLPSTIEQRINAA